jgi:hypothetical protein
MTLKSLVAATALVAGLAGAAQAAPSLNAGAATTTVKTDSAVTPVYYGCYPVYRWVYTYYGWQQVYAGQRCPGYYGNPYGYRPHGYFGYRGPGVRIGIGF